MITQDRLQWFYRNSLKTSLKIVYSLGITLGVVSITIIFDTITNPLLSLLRPQFHD